MGPMQVFFEFTEGNPTKNDLQTAGIEFFYFSLNVRDSVKKGFLVSSNDLPKIQELGFDTSKLSATEYDGIAQMIKPGQKKTKTSEPVKETKKVEVAIRSWDGSNEDSYLNSFKRISIEHLSPFLNEGEKINIRVPHNSSFDYKQIKEEGFHVLIWSSIKGARRTEDTPSRLWDYSVNCRDTSFPASGSGIGIIPSDHSDYVVAELIERKFLYIHYDICHAGSENELLIYDKIMAETARILGMSEKDYRRALKQTKCAYFIGELGSAEPYYYRAIKECIFPAINKVFEVHLCNGERVDLDLLPKTDPDDDIFRIFIFGFPAVPENPTPEKIPKVIFGKKVPFAGEKLLGFSGRGSPLIDSASGIIVGEILDNNLFLFCQLAKGTDLGDRLEIFKLTLKTAAIELAKTPEQRKEEKKATIAKTFLRNRAKQKADLTGFIAEAEKKISEMAATVSQTSRKTSINENLLVFLERKHNGELTKKFRAEAEAILDMDQVRSFSIESEERKLLIQTEILYREHPITKERHELGEFQIVINMENELETIGGKRLFCLRLINLTRQVKGWYAPLIPKIGIPDLGTASAYLPTYLANQEFSAIVDLAIQFIESADLNGRALKILSDWPIASKTS